MSQSRMSLRERENGIRARTGPSKVVCERDRLVQRDEDEHEPDDELDRAGVASVRL